MSRRATSSHLHCLITHNTVYVNQHVIPIRNLIILTLTLTLYLDNLATNQAINVQHSSSIQILSMLNAMETI